MVDSLSLGHSMLLLSIPTFVVLSYIQAPYGKFTPDRSTNRWGPLIPAKYAWIIMESPSLYCSILTFITYSHKQQREATGNQLLLILFNCHYLFRALLIPLCVLRVGAPMPLSVLLCAFVFCFFNGCMQGLTIGTTIEPFSIYQMKTIQLIGIIVFFIGFAANQHADRQLRDLRKHGYGIPHGGLLEYCSAGNYTGELIEWIGFVFVSNFSLASISFLGYSAANLIPRAKGYHRFYQTTFKDYPKHRTAIIPFIY